MFDGEQVLEVLPDGLDRVKVTDDVSGLLPQHHLRGIRVPADSIWDHTRIRYTQALYPTHSENRWKYVFVIFNNLDTFMLKSVLIDSVGDQCQVRHPSGLIL